jgi:Alginate lyase
VIDLSALIALLTALASAAAPIQPGPEPRTGEPPAHHCRAAPAGLSDRNRSGTDPAPQSPSRTAPQRTGPPRTAPPASPPDSEPRPESTRKTDDSNEPESRELRSDSDGDDEETTTTPPADDGEDRPKPQSSGQKSAQEESAQKKSAQDRSAQEKSSQEKSSQEKSSQEKSSRQQPRETREQESESADGSGGTDPTTAEKPPAGGRPDESGARTRDRAPRPDRPVPPPEPGGDPDRTATPHPDGDRRPDDRNGTPPGSAADGTGDRRPDVSTDDGYASDRYPDDPLPDDPTCADPPVRPRPGQPAPGQPAPDPPDRSPSTDHEVPADLVDLGNWYLTLPTGSEGDPDTIQPQELAGYSSPYFQLNESGDGVVFTAPVDGATTRNSDYPRSELREMNGTEEAAWSNGSGTHTLRATEAVTELPESKPELVTAQIHGGDDDVLQIRLEGSHLMVQYADGAEQVTLDPDYRLGTPYDIEIVAAANSVQVGYNGEPKAELPLAGKTWYFKAGAYVQSNPTKGDAGGAAGQVIIYSLEVDHR